MTDHHQTGPQLHAPPDASAHPLLIPSLSHSVPFNDCESETCLRACHAPGAAPPRAAANRNGLATEAGDRLMLMPPPACLPAWLAASYCTRLAGVAPSKHGRRRSRAASRAARQRSPPLRERAAHGVRMHLLQQLGAPCHRRARPALLRGCTVAVRCGSSSSASSALAAQPGRQPPFCCAREAA